MSCYKINFIFIEFKTVNLKGPRVKHVCRTAESALRQIPATFESIIEKTDDVDSQSKYYILDLIF